MIFKISFQKHCIFLMGPTILWFFRCGEHNLKNLPNSLKKKKKKKSLPNKLIIEFQLSYKDAARACPCRVQWAWTRLVFLRYDWGDSWDGVSPIWKVKAKVPMFCWASCWVMSVNTVLGWDKIFGALVMVLKTGIVN